MDESVPYDGMYVLHASPRNALQVTCRSTAANPTCRSLHAVWESPESSTGLLAGIWTKPPRNVSTEPWHGGPSGKLRRLFIGCMSTCVIQVISAIDRTSAPHI
jgi:hypothetical protein